MTEKREAESAICVLTRWEDAGAQWRVDSLDGDRVIISLRACTGETVDRLTSTDPQLLAYVAARPSSEVDRPPRRSPHAPEEGRVERAGAVGARVTKALR